MSPLLNNRTVCEEASTLPLLSETPVINVARSHHSIGCDLPINLVLLKQSPLESVEAYDTIVTVWVHGKPISRDSLAANSSK